ncbi:GPGG-motif small membrane protein [Aeromicrobium sp. UC242_57]|uniref:GPGG-motif small membrane protein n=1 Tax=Aeromicrobium sp. UC242_57 TaxID=3374624 RepID=UPI0037BED797
MARPAVESTTFINERPHPGRRTKENTMGFLLWIIAVALVIYGIITLVNGSILLGIVLIVLGLAVGPGGWSIFNRRGART